MGPQQLGSPPPIGVNCSSKGRSPDSSPSSMWTGSSPKNGYYHSSSAASVASLGVPYSPDGSGLEDTPNANGHLRGRTRDGVQRCISENSIPIFFEPNCAHGNENMSRSSTGSIGLGLALDTEGQRKVIDDGELKLPIGEAPACVRLREAPPLPKLTARQQKYFGNGYVWPRIGESPPLPALPALEACAPEAQGQINGSPPPPPPPSKSPYIDGKRARNTTGSAIKKRSTTAIPSRQRLQTPEDRQTLSQRRGAPPTLSIDIPPPQGASTSSNQVKRAIDSPPKEAGAASIHHETIRAAPSTSPMSLVRPDSGESLAQPTASSSQLTFDGSMTEPNDLPVGELFRTLQIWFDQEGFREIAPLFTFTCYNAKDDLLYFSTPRLGYPFHHGAMLKKPVLRKVVAPYYEEAFALLEGELGRCAAGRRDFLSKQANLKVKHTAKYIVKGTEGKGKWVWRFTYEVEERRSLMGRALPGERAFFPLTFACSPEILNPGYARKSSFINRLTKNFAMKARAVLMDENGRSTLKSNGKLLRSRFTRNRGDSGFGLLASPRHSCHSEASSEHATASQTQSFTRKGSEDVQAQLLHSIAARSTSRLRPGIAQLDGDEQQKPRQRRHTTAGSTASSLPTPIHTSIFGMAPQPTRATPCSSAIRRPLTTEERKLQPHRDHCTVTAFAPLTPS